MNKHNFVIAPEWALVVVCALWGTSFYLLSVSLRDISPGLLVALRFSFGALLMGLILRSKLLTIRTKDMIAGFATGTFIFFGYFLQTVGLQTIPSSISAFLTALYVPFVPLLQFILLRKKPGWIVGGCILLAFCGMALIIDPTKLSFDGSFGEWITVLSAVSCALEIIILGHFAGLCDPKVFCFTQLVSVSIWSWLFCGFFETIRFTPTPSLIICLSILTAMIVFNQFAMNWGQKFVPPARAALIYTLEPVFAGIVGFIVGERLSTMALLGALLVVGSVLCSNWLPRYLKDKRIASNAS